MLERVSPSAECAAHLFLRRLEAPVRSNRHLGSSFWRHGSKNIDIPPWWPLYLEKINNSHIDGHHARLRPKPQSSVVGLPSCRNSNFSTSTSRGINASARSDQAVSAQAISEDVSEQTNIQSFGGISATQKATEKAQAAPRSLKPAKKRATSQIFKQEERFEKVWGDFAALEKKETRAQPVLRILTKSSAADHLEKALQAFSFIARDRRISDDYFLAADICVRLRSYSRAIQIVSEAVSNPAHQDVLFRFLALLISNNLWDVVAQTWKEICESFGDASKMWPHKASSKRQNFAGDFMHLLEVVPGLVSKVSKLSSRLTKTQATEIPQSSELTDLCQKLALLAVESDRVMSSVLEDDLFDLLSTQASFDKSGQLHCAALATLHRMTDKGSRSQLALRIYDNLIAIYPQVFLPKWLFGTLLNICALGQQPSSTYRSLLQDYLKIYGDGDSKMYLQVLKACANVGEVKHVQEVYDEYCRFHSPNSADDLNPLVKVHAVSGNYKEARREFDKVEERSGFKPSTKNWNSLLLAYSRSPLPLGTFDIFEEMLKRAASPDSYTWSILVAVAAKQGDTKLARNLIAQAKQAGIIPPLPMIGAMVDAYLNRDERKEAWDTVLDTSRRSARKGAALESPIRLWNSLFRYYAFKADTDAILRTQAKMKEFDIQADGMTYAALMTALVVQGRTSDAAEILRTLRSSQAISANEFHYSIIIHGFAMEKNRDAAQTIYQEMLAQFHRATPSARLSMLYLRAYRDEQVARSRYLSGDSNYKPDFRPTLESIQSAITEVNPAELAANIPNPGFGRRSARAGVSEMFFGSLITFLQRNQAYKPAQNIIEVMKTEAKGISGPNTDHLWTSNLHLLSTELESAVNLQDWTKTSYLWNQIVKLAVHRGTPILPARRAEDISEPESVKLRNIQFLAKQDDQFTSMLQTPEVVTSASRIVKVLPSHRYALSRPLSQYLKALDKQQDHQSMITTIEDLRARGFSLSSKNWNSLIQALCRSISVHDHRLAFTLFDKYLLPNAPSWKVLSRGKWVLPSKERPRHMADRMYNPKKQDDRKDRQMLEKANPGLLMPSYYTMIHLAYVWLKALRASAQGDRSTRRWLEEKTPETVKLVLQTPYRGDRVQGILLRGRQVIGDLMQRPRETRGLLKSVTRQQTQDIIGNLSPKFVADLRAKLVGGKLGSLAKKRIIMNTFGDFFKERIVLASKGRLETPRERRIRVRITMLRQAKALQHVLRQMIKSLQVKSGMSNTPTHEFVSIKLDKPTARAMDSHSKQTKLETVANAIAPVLSDVSRQYLHEISLLSARKQKGTISTHSLLRSQAVRMVRVSSQAPIPMAVPGRQKKLLRRREERAAYAMAKSKIPETT